VAVSHCSHSRGLCGSWSAGSCWRSLKTGSGPGHYQPGSAVGADPTRRADVGPRRFWVPIRRGGWVSRIRRSTPARAARGQRDAVGVEGAAARTHREPPPGDVQQSLDRIWDGDSSRRGTLYSHVSRLRCALAAAEDVGVSRRSGGCLLSVDPMNVDLHRFRRLVTAVRRTEDPERAVSHYRAALALCRGNAFAGLDARWLGRLRASLNLSDGPLSSTGTS
jgi:hypothetical protein